MGSNSLQKMTLVAYNDATFKDSAKSDDSYDVLINPESYTLNYDTEVNQQSAQGAGESITTFAKRSPQYLNFKFLFDGTGVIKRGGEASDTSIDKPNVITDFEQFKAVVYKFDGSIHQPRYVQLQWGSLHYNCTLTSMQVTFKLFSPDGSPLRAEANCSFQGVIDEERLALVQNNQSPDLTHIRTVKKGDTLSLLCYREYGDSRYYYQVAQYNGLKDFKILTPGTKIIFPPISR